MNACDANSRSASPAVSRPSSSLRVRAANGPAKSPSTSMRPRSRSGRSSASASRSNMSPQRSANPRKRSGDCAGARSRACSSPSTRSIVRPMARVMSDGSSRAVISVRSSSATTSSQRGTTYRPAASSHTHAPSSRSRRYVGYGSRESSSRVAVAPDPAWLMVRAYAPRDGVERTAGVPTPSGACPWCATRPAEGESAERDDATEGDQRDHERVHPVIRGGDDRGGCCRRGRRRNGGRVGVAALRHDDAAGADDSD